MKSDIVVKNMVSRAKMLYFLDCFIFLLYK